MEDKIAKNLEEIYKRLFSKFGPQGWWPGETPFEVIIGAILTQNTNWINVERAISNLKKNKLLSPKKLKQISTRRLASLIKPAGYFNVKAKRLKSFINFLFKEYKGSIKNMFTEDFLSLRTKLLGVKGIGYETADSILLYAGNKPIFVVDAYTKRILFRHNFIDRKSDYPQIQNLFMDHLEQDINLFNEFHALIVRLGKEICKNKPLCEICPLNDLSYSIDYSCDSCGRPLPRPHERYNLKIELYASPEVVITEEDLKRDSAAEMKALLSQMEKMDPQELEEDVYVAYRLNLCKRCRDIFNMRIKQREFV
jgi:endonuclease-3 related protein